MFRTRDSGEKMEGHRWTSVSWWGSEFMSTGLYDRMQIVESVCLLG